MGVSLGTMQSHNDGRFWSYLKSSSTSQNFTSHSNRITLNFSLSDERNVPDFFDFIDVQYSYEKNSKQAYVTLDTGKTWTKIPSSSFAAIVLNFGSPIVAIDEKFGSVVYSLDELKTFKNLNALKSIDIVVFADRLLKNDVSICIVSRSSADNKLKFTVIDFTPIFGIFVLLKRQKMYSG